ncbi:B12-binding domain-containing radical SAM protein [Bdellovibrionota bacterium]
MLKLISKKATFPPLGLLTVAAMVPKEWDKKLVDVNVADLTDEQIEWADIIFIGAMIVQQECSKEIISRCKEKGKKVVAGGPLFTTDHERFSGVDHFVLNEAEVTLPLFLKDLEEGNLKPIYTSQERPDVAKTPIPLWSLINFKNYLTMAVQYSRGCPFDCEFCDIVIMNGRVPRTKSPEQMLREFQALYDAGWRKPVFIVDDNFIGNKRHVKQMLPELIKWQKEHKYPFSLFTEASTNLADDQELMQMMSAANFYKVFLGIETPSIDGLKECGKFHNVKRELTEVVKTIHQNGMQVMGGFIVGFDSDTESIFEAQIKFIQQTGVVTAMVGLLTALPQTRLWHRLKAEGRLLKESSGENTDGTLNFIPKINRDTLIDGFNRIMATIYSPKEYYKRINTFIKSYKPTVRNKMSVAEIINLFKSMWEIGVRSKARFRFWLLLLRTAVTKMKAFPMAVELAIMGQHFEKTVARSLANANTA